FHNSIFPYGPFECRDGEVVLAVQNDREWLRLCAALPELQPLAGDDRFATAERRHRERNSLFELIAGAFRCRSVVEAESLLERADVPFARTRTVEDAAVHSELIERNRWQSFDSEAGAIELLRSPFDQGSRWTTP